MTTIGSVSGGTFPFQIHNAPPPPPRKLDREKDGEGDVSGSGVKQANQPDPGASGRKLDVQA
ncbi:MAG: hypothetical protein J0H67_09540 [Rhodospirillales bacterium]|nr:hypothetical protein [Rhodospirillales bacterium]